MVSGKEAAKIRTFVRQQLGNDPDLSTLTIGILKKQYLALVGRESLSADAKTFLKQVVEEELLKMQVSDGSGNELEEDSEPQKKRAREEKNGNAGPKTGPRAKRSRRQTNSSDSEDSEDCKSEREEESDKDKQIKNTSGTGQQHKRRTNQISGDDQSSEESTEEMNMTNKRPENVNQSSDGSPKEIKNGSKSVTSGKKRSSTKVKENASPRDDENEANSESSSDGETGKIQEEKNDELAQDSDSSSSDSVEGEQESEKEEKISKKLMTSKKEEGEKSGKEMDTGNESDGSSDEHDGSESGDSGPAKISMGKKNDEPAQDSDSSDSDSLEDEEKSEPVKKTVGKKKKTTEKEDSGKAHKNPKDDNKAVVRLKRYISLCGVRPNYKKRLDGCRSVRSMVDVLKKELEDLGVKGRPSIEKCKKVRLKRERAQELAELDISNIITTQGRPKRRGASTFEEHRGSPQPSTYLRALNSSSDSDQDHTARRHRKATDWSNLQGIISDDADSN